MFTWWSWGCSWNVLLFEVLARVVSGRFYSIYFRKPVSLISCVDDAIPRLDLNRTISNLNREFHTPYTIIQFASFQNKYFIYTVIIQFASFILLTSNLLHFRKKNIYTKMFFIPTQKY